MTDEVEIHRLAHHAFGDEMTRGQKVWYFALRSFVVGVARSYFRASVTGAEHIPATGPFILSPIHRSNLDTPLVCLVTKRRLRYMGKASMWKSTFGAWFLSGAGGFPVRRGTADREALRVCQEVLERGEPLVLFPEGTRQYGPEPAEFFDGAAFLACRTGAPIVPVGLGGTEAAQRKGSKMVYPVKMTVVVGEPLYPPPLSESGRVSRKAVRQMTADLSDRIQVLFDEAQALAGRPNPPHPSTTVDSSSPAGSD